MRRSNRSRDPLATLLKTSAAIAAMLCATAPALAQMSDYARGTVEQPLDSDAAQPRVDIFDGTTFQPDVSLEEALDHMNGVINASNSAVSAWNRLPSSAYQDPTAPALLERINALSDIAQAMEAAFPAFETTKLAESEAEAADAAARREADRIAAGDAKVMCEAFLENTMTTERRDPMQRLIVALNGTPMHLDTPQSVARHIQAAAEVDASCEQIGADALAAADCYYAINGPDMDPVQWCAAAAEGERLGQELALAGAQRLLSSRSDYAFASVEEFMDADGWLRIEGPMDFTSYFALDKALDEHTRPKVEALLDAAGAELGALDEFAALETRITALRTAVEDTADGWDMPFNAGQTYATGLARDGIASWHDDADIRDSYVTRDSWQIYRNDLGVPEYRTMVGVVLFKRPSEPLCQLRGFTVTEDHIGGGQYQEASGVRFSGVRYQACR